MEQITYMTELQKKLIDILEEMGFELSYETPFYPYRVDVYCSKYHLAFEADGPQHSTKHDRERDERLWNTYRLPVIRFNVTDIYNYPDEVRTRSIEFVKEYAPSSIDRLAVAAEEAPWI